MSGGSIADYQYFRMNDVIEDIEKVMAHNDVPDEFDYSYKFSEKTLEEFEKGIVLMKQAIVYAHRIDWLVSGDDNEDAFHERLEEELDEIVE